MSHKYLNKKFEIIPPSLRGEGVGGVVVTYGK